MDFVFRAFYFFLHMEETGPTANRPAGHSSLANTVSCKFSIVVFLAFAFFKPVFPSLIPGIVLFFTEYARRTAALQWSTPLYQKFSVKI